METYKVALSPPMNGKIPHGSPLWPQFNASFENVAEPSDIIAARLYDGSAITTWHKDHWRTSANYLLGQHIGIDFDTGDERSSMAQLLKDPFIAKYASILHTTPSHTPEAARGRVLFLLDTPIHQPHNYTLAVSALLWMYGNADRQCKDPVRFFYGGMPGACEMEWNENTLPLSLVKDLIAKYQKSGQTAKRRVQSTDYAAATPDEAQVVEALKVIPPWGIDYDQWIAVLMAIHSAYPNGQGLAIADSWAQGAEGEVERKWRSFKNNGNTTGAVTIATVFGIAKEHGYVRQ